MVQDKKKYLFSQRCNKLNDYAPSDLSPANMVLVILIDTELNCQSVWVLADVLKCMFTTLGVCTTFCLLISFIVAAYNSTHNFTVAVIIVHITLQLLLIIVHISLLLLLIEFLRYCAKIYIYII